MKIKEDGNNTRTALHMNAMTDEPCDNNQWPFPYYVSAGQNAAFVEALQSEQMQMEDFSFKVTRKRLGKLLNNQSKMKVISWHLCNPFIALLL